MKCIILGSWTRQTTYETTDRETAAEIRWVNQLSMRRSRWISWMGAGTSATGDQRLSGVRAMKVWCIPKGIPRCARCGRGGVKYNLLSIK